MPRRTRSPTTDNTRMMMVWSPSVTTSSSSFLRERTNMGCPWRKYGATSADLNLIGENRQRGLRHHRVLRQLLCVIGASMSTQDNAQIANDHAQVPNAP